MFVPTGKVDLALTELPTFMSPFPEELAWAMDAMSIS